MDAVTGAFSYSGAAIARELTRRGRPWRTLTNHPPRHTRTSPDDPGPHEVYPLDLTDPDGLRRALGGVDTLYNTYWVRFPHGETTFESAVAGSAALFAAAADAGVRRVVHVSITHADIDSPYPYFRGKAQVEQHLRESGLSYAVARPAILFGGDGVLINNMAWFVRRSPVVLYGGDGQYRIRAIHLRDLATLAADLGERDDDVTLDAVGPESVSFVDLLRHIRTAVGAHSVLLPAPGPVFPLVARALGGLLRDTLLTRDEYLAMAAGLADSAAPSTGSIRITDWIADHGTDLGARYAHEIRRHYRPGPALSDALPSAATTA